jgi:uncharacterized membrane protein YbhN (UPF0104 family)
MSAAEPRHEVEPIEEEHGHKPHGRGMRILAWLPGVVMLAALVGIATHLGEQQRFLRMVRQAEPAWLLLAAALQAVTYLVAAGVWKQVIARGGDHARLRSLAPLAVARLFVDQVLPTGGLGGRFLIIQSMRRRGVRAPIAMAAILVDLVTLYAAFAVAVVASLAVLWQFHDLNRLILTVTCLFALIATGIPLAALWLSGEDRQPPRWLRRLPRAHELLQQIARAPQDLVRDPGVLARGAGLQLAIFVLDGFSLWAMLRAVGEDPSPMVGFAAFVMAQAAATVILTPGGLGTFEAAAVGMLTFLRVDVEPALAATLLLRGFTYWLPMLPGLVISRREMKASVRERRERRKHPGAAPAVNSAAAPPHPPPGSAPRSGP